MKISMHIIGLWNMKEQFQTCGLTFEGTKREYYKTIAGEFLDISEYKKALKLTLSQNYSKKRYQLRVIFSLIYYLFVLSLFTRSNQNHIYIHFHRHHDMHRIIPVSYTSLCHIPAHHLGWHKFHVHPQRWQHQSLEV